MVSAQREVQDDKSAEHLTLLAVDFVCPTSDFFGIETELDAVVKADLSDLCDTVLTRYGATITAREGTSLLACFGYPAPGEGDARNAIKAALEIAERIANLASRGPDQSPISVRSAIHTGPVTVQQQMSAGSGFKVAGNACTSAFELMREARAGEVLVSSESIGRDQNKFKISGQRQISRSRTMHPMTVLSVATVRDGPGYDGQGSAGQGPGGPAPADGMTPFTGRRDEIEHLSALAWQALEGAQRSVAVIGEPGVGKTRLVREFLATHPPADTMIWSAQCDDYVSSEPLGPILQVLRQVLGLHRAMPAADIVEQVHQRLEDLGLPRAPHLQTLVGALRPGLSPEEGRRSAQIPDIAHSLIDLLRALSARALQVLSIDDLQWADQESRQIIDAVCRADIERTLVVATVREDQFAVVEQRLFEIVRLESLSDDDARAFVSALAPGISNLDCDRVLESSGRNALYLEEICHSYRQEPTLRGFGKEGSQTVWLEKLVKARVRDLPDREREVLSAASVIGYDVPRNLLDKVLDQPADKAAFEALSDQSFLLLGETDDVLRFKHGMTRDIIYRAVPWQRRRAFHRLAAQSVIDASGPDGAIEQAERLAYHYKAAEDWEPAALYSEFAGNRASVVSALDQATSHYVAALDCLTALGLSSESYAHWLHLARSLALACVYDPARDQLKLLERAVGVAEYYGTAREICEARFWAGYVAYALGDAARSLGHLERALEDAKAGRFNELASQIGACLGQSYAAGGRYDDATQILDKTIEIKRPLRKKGRPAVSLAYALACKAAVLGDRGDFADAYACFDEAIQGLSSAGHEVEGSVLCWKAGVLLWQGEWLQAKTVAEDAVAIAERVRSLYLLDIGLSLRGFANWKVTGGKTPLAQIERATARLEAGEKRLFVSLNYGWLAHIRSVLDDVPGMRTATAHAIRRERQMDRLGAAMAYRALARFSSGNTDAQAQYFDRAETAAAERQSRHELAKTKMARASVLSVGSQSDKRERLLDEAEAAFAAMGMQWHLEKAQSMRNSG